MDDGAHVICISTLDGILGEEIEHHERDPIILNSLRILLPPNLLSVPPEKENGTLFPTSIADSTSCTITFNCGNLRTTAMVICPVPPATSTITASFPKLPHGYDLGTDSAAKTPIPFIAKAFRSRRAGSEILKMYSNIPLSTLCVILNAVLFTANESL
jgi:hypothetical protein